MQHLPFTRLQLQLAVGTKSPGEPSGGRSVFPAVPIRVEVDAVIREVDQAVFDWSSVTCREAGLTTYPPKFAQRVDLIRANLDALYDAPSYVIDRWVSAGKVSHLPPEIVGCVVASGDAIITFEADGIYGALELLTLYRKSCSMLRIDALA